MMSNTLKKNRKDGGSDGGNKKYINIKKLSEWDDEVHQLLYAQNSFKGYLCIWF